MRLLQPSDRLAHECDACVYVGSFKYLDVSPAPKHHYDVYLCHRSLVVRFGSDGPDYESSPFEFALATSTDDLLRYAIIESYSAGYNLVDLAIAMRNGAVAEGVLRQQEEVYR